MSEQEIGAIKQAAQKAAADVEKRAKLADAPAKLANIQEQIPLADKELADFIPKVEALRERAKGKARAGLVHDMARFIKGLRASATTPEAAVEQANLMAAYEKEHGPLGAAGAVDLEAQNELPTYERSLEVLRNRVNNLQRDLASATQAKGQYDALEPAGEAVDASAELAEVQGLLDSAKAEKLVLQNKLLDIQAAIKNRAEAAQKTVDAKRHHGDVAGWLLIAEQLAPAGIPVRLLSAALAPVNAMLAQASADSTWPEVVITDDMDVLVGGRLYQLQSESFKWRADAMLAQTVATLSGIKIMLLDRFDVLDLPGRVELFNWLDTLVDMEDIDTAMIFGTTKAPPREGLPDSFTAYWVADGTVGEVVEPQTAAAAV